jgi:electron transfer flavoprotein beta subunit
MRIIACCKAAPEEQDIVVAADGTLDFERAAWKFGSYDLNAVEAARVLADATGGTVVGVSVGSDELAGSKLRKDILSRGLDELVVVTGEGVGNADSYQTAVQLKDAIEALGGYDLVLCGAGSSDLYAQQVGNQLGALLGVPTLNAINNIEAQGTSLVVERVLEDRVQRLEVGLPAVLSVTSGINTPRIAGMKDILAAGKKPVAERVATSGTSAAAPSTETLSVLAPPQAERRGELLEGDVNEVVSRFVELVAQELK